MQLDAWKNPKERELKVKLPMQLTRRQIVRCMEKSQGTGIESETIKSC